MSSQGLTAAQLLVADATALFEGLTDQQWAADSACHGWRVQDVATHMGYFFNTMTDPNLKGPTDHDGTAERLNDASVRERADWSPQEVLDYYTQQAAGALVALEALQAPEMSEATLQLAELGTYRLAQLTDAVAFDHLVHLTCDLMQPFGPLPAAQVSTAEAIDPALDWMLDGLPKMCSTTVAPALEGPIGLRLTGATQRSYVIDKNGDGLGVTETDSLPEDVATSSAEDFLRWATMRTAWRPAVDITGSRERVSAVLDKINIV
ncbi:MAG: maleylpyruvate isomerase family mycothiol-dependent enzyme [Cumulibacter sp.]